MSDGEVERVRAARAILDALTPTRGDSAQSVRRKTFAGLSLLCPELSLETRLEIAYESTSLRDWE